MKLHSFIKAYFKITNLESICIAHAVKHNEWHDFKHSKPEKLVLYIASKILK